MATSIAQWRIFQGVSITEFQICIFNAYFFPLFWSNLVQLQILTLGHLGIEFFLLMQILLCLISCWGELLTEGETKKKCNFTSHSLIMKNSLHIAACGKTVARILNIWINAMFLNNYNFLKWIWNRSRSCYNDFTETSERKCQLWRNVSMLLNQDFSFGRKHIIWQVSLAAEHFLSIE